ncbi:hypothetical protein CBL_08585 [Carabus blaptoides fortunei]
MNVVNDWFTTVWPALRNNYDSIDILNADETGLFYKLTPDKTLKFIGESCVGGKMSKMRITVLVAANMSGTEKRKLFIIGKSANPRCFKNKTLPIKYRSNSKAWMTSSLFMEELLQLDTDLKRKILLLVDNFPAQPEVPLNQIKLGFLPPNTTSKLQPMDQGVIHSLKCRYRKIMLMNMLEEIDNGQEYSMSLLDAVNYIHLAWQEVSRETIANCFKHAGLFGKGDEFDSDDELPLNDWLKIHADNFEEKYSICSISTTTPRSLADIFREGIEHYPSENERHNKQAPDSELVGSRRDECLDRNLIEATDEATHILEGAAKLECLCEIASRPIGGN